MSTKRITAVAVISGLIIVAGAAVFVLSKSADSAAKLLHNPAFMAMAMLLFLAIAGLVALGALFYHSHVTSCQNKSCSFHPRHKRQEELFDFASITSPIQFVSEDNSAEANLAFIMSGASSAVRSGADSAAAAAGSGVAAKAAGAAKAEPAGEILGQLAWTPDIQAADTAEDSFDYDTYRYLNADLDAVTEAAVNKMTQKLVDRGLNVSSRIQPGKSKIIQQLDTSTAVIDSASADFAAAQKLVSQALSASGSSTPVSTDDLLAAPFSVAPTLTAAISSASASAVSLPTTSILASTSTLTSELSPPTAALDTVNPWLLWDVSLIEEPKEKPSMEFTNDMVPKVLELLNQQQQLSQQQQDLNQQLINRLWGQGSKDKEKSGQSAAIEWLVDEHDHRGRHFKSADGNKNASSGGVLNSGIDRLSDYMQLLIRRSEPVADDGYRQVS